MKKLLLATHTATIDPTTTPAAEGGAWMMLLPAGEIHGRDGRRFIVGDRAAMQAIVDATKARAGATDPMVDYDHQSVFGAVPGVGGQAPAAGWIKALEVRDDGIWGRIAWTAAATAKIQASEYRYISPTFLHDPEGNVRCLTAAALTNFPALDLTAALSARDRQLDTSTGAPMKAIAKLLGLAEDATEDQILAALTTKLAGQATLTKIAAATGKADATGDDLVVAVQSAISAAKPDPAKFVPIEAYDALRNEFAALSAGTVVDKARDAVEKAVAEGKIPPALKSWATDYANRDLAAFSAYVAAAPKVVAPGGVDTAKGEPPASDNKTLTETDLAVCSAMGLKPEAFAANRAQQEKN